MTSWLQRKQEESYFSQLDQILVQRLHGRNDHGLSHSMHREPKRQDVKNRNKVSMEISDELDRLESLIIENGRDR